MTENPFDLDALLDLWSDPPASVSAAVAAFRGLYTDPVLVNGTMMTVEAMARRAQGLSSTFAEVQREILDVCRGENKVAVAFRMGGRQIGPLGTGAGELAPTGKDVVLRVIDILTITNGRISEITMVADELGALARIGAAGLFR